MRTIRFERALWQALGQVDRLLIVCVDGIDKLDGLESEVVARFSGDEHLFDRVGADVPFWIRNRNRRLQVLQRLDPVFFGEAIVFAAGVGKLDRVVVRSRYGQHDAEFVVGLLLEVEGGAVREYGFGLLGCADRVDRDRRAGSGQRADVARAFLPAGGEARVGREVDACRDIRHIRKFVERKRKWFGSQVLLFDEVLDRFLDVFDLEDEGRFADGAADHRFAPPFAFALAPHEHDRFVDVVAQPGDDFLRGTAFDFGVAGSDGHRRS